MSKNHLKNRSFRGGPVLHKRQDLGCCIKSKNFISIRLRRASLVAFFKSGRQRYCKFLVLQGKSDFYFNFFSASDCQKKSPSFESGCKCTSCFSLSKHFPNFFLIFLFLGSEYLGIAGKSPCLGCRHKTPSAYLLYLPAQRSLCAQSPDNHHLPHLNTQNSSF